MAIPRLCSVIECGKMAVQRGWCWGHYYRDRRYGDPLKGAQKSNIPKAVQCTVPGCDKPPRSFGLCCAHYTRQWRHGSPTGGGPKYAEAQKFLKDHVNYSGDECLFWPFSRGHKGDGAVWFRGRQTSTNYAMCCLAHGDAPSPKHEAAHSCGRGHDACINPNHLRWATRKENHADKLIHGTHRRGELTPTSKLTISQVREIRNLRGTESLGDTAVRYGVTKSTIHAVQIRKNWAWLP